MTRNPMKYPEKATSGIKSLGTAQQAGPAKSKHLPCGEVYSVYSFQLPKQKHMYKVLELKPNEFVAF